VSRTLILVFDLAAVILLALGVYQPRYRRRGVTVLLVGINVGAATVSWALSDAEVSPGLGLALFGALAIIRLRSREIELEDVSYCFAALAMGLLAGLRLDPSWLGPALSAGIIVSLFVIDHPALLRADASTSIRLDGVVLNPAEAQRRVEALGAVDVRDLEVVRADETDASTLVRFRFARSEDPLGGPPPRAGAQPATPQK